MDQPVERPQIWEETYRVTFYEVDAKNRIFLPNLWKFLQETAWNHANHLGIGYTDLARNGHFWILSRLALDIHQYPAWGEKIRVKTWLVEHSRLFAYRDFSITDERGVVIGGAKSAWVVLDFKNRKPQRIEPFLRGLNPLPDQHGAETLLERLPPLIAPKEENPFAVRYGDLDIHLHVNNSRYLEWILNSYSFEIHQRHEVSSLEIHFLAESNFGDQILVRTEQQKDSPPTFLHSVVRRNDGQELCRARMRWKRIE